MSIHQCINLCLEICGLFFCIYLILILRLSQKKTKVELALQGILVTIIGVLTGEVITNLFLGNKGIAAELCLRVGVFISFFFGYLCVIASSRYLCVFVENRVEIKKWIFTTIMVICFLKIGLLFLNLFTEILYGFDVENNYVRYPGLGILYALTLVCIGLNYYILFRYRTHMKKSEICDFVIYMFIPMIGILWQMAYTKLGVQYYALILSVGFIYLRIHIKQEERYRTIEEQLYHSQEQIILSQIRPHFLFNTLSSIRCLCKKDGDAAQEAIDHFSGFLRSNINLLSSPMLIPFEKELEYTRHYLEIEKMRFGELLEIKYAIQETSFWIPPLTLQPMVENAVKHGVGKCMHGGVVEVETESTDLHYIVRVTDTGNGGVLDLGEQRGGIGVQNVRRRIGTVSKGKLIIESRPGLGTQSIIYIPKGE